MKPHLSYDTADLLFRLLFSLIFIGLGLEHIFSDELIQGLMPEWLGNKRVAAVATGVVLLCGGLSVALGYRVPAAALILGGFLIAVTAAIRFGPATCSKNHALPGRTG